MPANCLDESKQVYFSHFCLGYWLICSFWTFQPGIGGNQWLVCGARIETKGYVVSQSISSIINTSGTARRGRGKSSELYNIESTKKNKRERETIPCHYGRIRILLKFIIKIILPINRWCCTSYENLHGFWRQFWWSIGLVEKDLFE